MTGNYVSLKNKILLKVLNECSKRKPEKWTMNNIYYFIKCKYFILQILKLFNIKNSKSYVER